VRDVQLAGSEEVEARLRSGKDGVAFGDGTGKILWQSGGRMKEWRNGASIPFSLFADDLAIEVSLTHSCLSFFDRSLRFSLRFN